MVIATAIKQKQSIMVINNNLDIIELLNEGLELDGYDIIIAVDEDEALNILDKITPDMVIIDTVTADAHSLHILDSVKNKSDVPVVIVTQDNELETLKEMFGHGADDIVYKPINMRALTARIRGILKRWYHFTDKALIPTY
jgi:DNA-binding response OmpR family regulator